MERVMTMMSNSNNASNTTVKSSSKNGPRKLPRIIYNDDSCTLRTVPQPHSIESIRHALDYLKGTQVDCLCWLLGEQMAYSWPSKVIENYHELKARGANLTTGWDAGGDVMASLHHQGIDYLPILIEQAHRQGLTFIGSFRMNDTHLKSYPNSVLAPEFWKKHQQLRLWEITDAKSYYNAALDYSYPEVRNRYRDAIAEVITEYDLDGIELDFSRTPFFFQPSEAWEKRKILTRFVREIGALLEKRGRERGRELTLILRVPCLERTLQVGGIDARQWIREKLAPIFVISEFVNNYNLDITPWLALTREAGVLLYPAVEAGPAFNRVEFYSTLVRNPASPGQGGFVPLSNAETVNTQRAMAQNYLAQGPDGIAMFNFPCILAQGDNSMHHDRPVFEQLTTVLREVGSLKTLAKKDKLFTYYRDLPIYVEAGRPRRFHQGITFAVRGKDIRNATATIRFHQIAERNPHADGQFRQSPYVQPGVLKYYLNDHEIVESELKRIRVDTGRLRSGFQIKAHEAIEITIPGRRLVDGENSLAIEMPHFPQENDPYVHIYDLEVELRF